MYRFHLAALKNDWPLIRPVTLLKDIQVQARQRW